MGDRRGGARLAGRLLWAYAVVFLLLIGGLGFLVDLSIRADLEPAELATVRRDLAVAAILAGAVGVLAVGVVAHLLARPLRRLTAVASEIADGKLDLRPGRSSVRELDRLGKAIGTIAGQLGARIADLDAERRRLRTLLEALGLGVVLVDGRDAVVYSNEAAGALLGGVPSRLAEVAPIAIRRIVHEARGSRTSVVGDIELGSPVRFVRLTATPIEGGVVLVLEDVTERRRVEAMRTDFVAAASHELKTPIAVVLASLEAAETASTRDPERVGQFLDQAAAAARQLAQLASDLLDLSRLEGAAPTMAPVALHRVVEEEVEAMSSQAEGAGVALVTEVEEVTVMGSAPDCRLAVRNLIDNAIRHSPDGAKVEIRVAAGGSEATVTVTDEGVGIPTRALPRIFERFYRVDGGRSRATGGTGLGLAIVKHVAERHGGRIEVWSELGAGSVFELRLPALPREGGSSLTEG